MINNQSKGSTGAIFSALAGALPSPAWRPATLGDAAVPTVGGTADGADIYNWDGAAFSRQIDAINVP